MSHLTLGFTPRIKGGGPITFVGNRPNQAVYWSLSGYNPATHEVVSPVGSLKWTRTKTDNSSCSLNLYFAPESDTGGVYDIVEVIWNS